jgi:regulator of RNase E activity RraA
VGEESELVARAAGLDTATISDALDRKGVAGQCAGIAPCGPFKLAGRAFTLRYGPAGVPTGTVGDYIDDVAPGGIVALDNSGRLDATVWGDILTEIAHRRRIGGTVIDGVNRDVQLCRELDYPVISRGVWMRTGKDRVQVEQVDQPINLGGVRVSPGDILIGDADGVVAIPRSMELEIIESAEDIQRAEESIRAACRQGARLDEARRDAGYHTLQSRRAK